MKPTAEQRRISTAAAAMGRRGGMAGRGRAKARTSEQARAAVAARWAKVRAAKAEAAKAA